MIVYTILIIAVSVVISTIVNIIIMKKTTEIAAQEVFKMEKRLLNNIYSNRK